MGLIDGLHNVPERFKRCCSSLAPPPTNNTVIIIAQEFLNWGTRNAHKGGARDYIKCFVFTRIYEKIVLRGQISRQMFLL